MLFTLVLNSKLPDSHDGEKAVLRLIDNNTIISISRHT